MIKSKRAFLILWGIVFALTVFLLLIIPTRITGITIVTLVFDCVGFISQLILWSKLARGEQNAADVFENTPAAVVTCVYLAILFVLSILSGALNLLSVKATLIANIIILAAVWILLIALFGVKGHIQRVNSRQRDHHIEL